MNFPAQTPDRQLPDGMGKAKAFTIIELLVAIGVTALLVSLMLTIVMNVSDGWNRSSGSLETGNQARTILDQITSDLQGAILKSDGNVWMAATIQSAAPPNWEAPQTSGGPSSPTIASSTPPPFPSLTAEPPVYQFGPYGVWFRFFTTVPGANSSTDDPTTVGDDRLTTLSAPRAVAYQIVRLPVVLGSTERRYALFRSEVLPNVTFQTGYNLMDPLYNTTGTDNDSGNISIRSPSRRNIIASNVVDFGVRLSSANGTNILFPKNGTDTFYQATSDTTKTGGVAVTFPDTVEVFVRILSAEGARQLALFENPPSGYTASTTWAKIVEANSRVYTRRIDLKAKSL